MLLLISFLLLLECVAHLMLAKTFRKPAYRDTAMTLQGLPLGIANDGNMILQGWSSVKLITLNKQVTFRGNTLSFSSDSYQMSYANQIA